MPFLQKIISNSTSTYFSDEIKFEGLKTKFTQNFNFSNVKRITQKGEIKSDLSRQSTQTRRRGFFEFAFDLSRVSDAELEKTIKKKIRTKYNTGYRISWIDMGLRSQIASTNPGSLPKFSDIPTQQTVRSRDDQTLASYSRRSRRIRRCNIATFSRCGLQSAQTIGLFEGTSQGRRKPSTISKAVDNLIKNTSSGTPLMQKKNSPGVAKYTKDFLRGLFEKPKLTKLLNTKYSSHQLKLDDSLHLLYMLPEVIFHRFQPSYNREEDKLNIKSRLVWCVPYVVVALERMFFGEVIDKVINDNLIKSNVIYPTGLNNRSIGHKCVKTFRQQIIKERHNYQLFYSNALLGSKTRKYIYSLDYSKYDSTIPNWSKDIFFSIMREGLDLSEHEEIVYSYLRMYIKYSPYFHKGELKFKNSGISSGLFITNIFDTWFNLLLIYFCELLFNKYSNYASRVTLELMDPLDVPINDNSSDISHILSPTRVMGDDGLVYWCEQQFNLFTSICKYLGMNITSKGKQDNCNGDLFFLGRYWDSDNVPNQSEKYMSSHIITRSKYYDKDTLPFSLDKLSLYRILSICLPLRDGKAYLDKTFGNWVPYVDWLKEGRGFYLLKDYPNTYYRYVPMDEALDVDSY